jgi:hypothetical protein
MSNDDFEIRFTSPDRFELQSMEGAITRYRRAQPPSPAAGDLKAFAGRYESDELLATLDITPGKQGLMIRLNSARPLGGEYRAVDPDTFQFSAFTMRFRRDNAGRIVGLDMNNPALRWVRFTRTGDAR